MNNFIFLIFILQICVFIKLIINLLKRKDEYASDTTIPLREKLILSTSCIVCAIIVYTNNTTYYSIFVLTGMIISFFGDLAMAGVLSFSNRLIGGMTLFGLAHICYFVGFIFTIIFMGKFKIGISILNLFILIIFICICNKFIRNKFNGDIDTFNIGVVYSTLILNMAINALWLAFASQGKFIITFIGASLFIISDGIIAFMESQLFQIKHSGLVIWITYIAAQMCIIISPIIK
ncbi:lysoplasmalogenase [Clostridium rectalis]|uniref:lysoplasmalogenase n=1 Tax=Clostridium rectalis TaxID=2040295 RepID=UPI000F6417CB|nr:lysoplasmalogenase [Clostridium rectalis]